MRVLTFALCIVFSFGFFLLMMQVKGDVSTLITQRQQQAYAQQQLKEDIRVLKAEFAHLASLERLGMLARKLDLVPLKVQQLQTWEDYSDVGAALQGIAIGSVGEQI